LHGRNNAFTLIELLVVLAVIAVLSFLVIPAINGLKKSGDMNTASGQISGVITTARTYAVANNTYTWVGFFEEDGSRTSTQPATAGTGRIVIDSVASADGTLPYTPTNPSVISGSRLIQTSRLLKIDGMHLVTFPANVGGTTITTPGAVTISNANIGSIGDTTPQTVSLTPFSYPLTGTAQYTFTKAIQFSPRGEARINNSTSLYPLQPAVEVGLQPAHGAIVDPTSVNLVSIQITGVGGDVTVYRR